MVTIDRAFWRGRRVFLTGHTGFKGGWLSLWLQRLGADVVGFALKPEDGPCLFDVANVADGMTSLFGDIRDADAITAAVGRARPEIVIHMAAQPLVRRAYADPVETYSINVMGLVHLFEAIRRTDGVVAVVNVTSDKCYENREWIWGYRETEAMGGYDPYSSSKGCAELVTAAYRRSYFQGASGPALASARAGNVIGGGDWSADRLIPDILRAISAKRSVRIRNPQAIRPWQHVLEPLSGYLLLAERLFHDGAAYADGWNFGPAIDDTRPVAWIAEKITAAWGAGASWERHFELGPHEAHFLSLDCTKARRKLQWRPKWNLTTAIDKIVEWHQAFLGAANMRSVTLQQIADYENQLFQGSNLSQV